MTHQAQRVLCSTGIDWVVAAGVFKIFFWLCWDLSNSKFINKLASEFAPPAMWLDDGQGERGHGRVGVGNLCLAFPNSMVCYLGFSRSVSRSWVKPRSAWKTWPDKRSSTTNARRHDVLGCGLFSVEGALAVPF